MSMYLGDFIEDATVYIPFTTNAADGGRESFSASLEEADIVVLKNGAAMTLDASTITISLDLNSRVGFHVVSVDMSNDADFTTGAEYAAMLYASDETLDSQAPAAVLATWSCENRVVDVARWKGSTPANLADTDKIPSSTQHMANDVITAAAAAADFGAELAALVETYIVNEGDATAVMQAIADVIAQDWIAGDATPLAIVAALKADAEWSNLATMQANITSILGNTNYPEGFVWIDPDNGDSGGDGSVGDPVTTFTEAVALSVGKYGLKFVPKGGGSYNASGETVDLGAFAIIDLNGWRVINADNVTWRQPLFSSLPGSRITVSTGAIALFGASHVKNITFGSSVSITYGYFDYCVFNGTSQTITLTTTNEETVFYGCAFGHASNGATTIDVSTGVTASVKLVECYGDVIIENLGAGETVEHYGWGKLTLAASCTGGTVKHTSHVEITDNAGGAVTLDPVTNDVTLADNSLTASKFDESTAFPLKSDDSGSTQVMRTGADGDTGETLSDQIDGVGGGATAEQIADAVWDETLSEHNTSGSTGNKLNTVSGGGGVSVSSEGQVIVSEG